MGEPFLGGPDQLGRACRTADRHRGELAGVEALDVRLGEQAVDVGGGAVPGGDALVDGELHDPCGIEAAHRPDGLDAAHERRDRRTLHPGEVEQREHRQAGATCRRRGVGQHRVACADHECRQHERDEAAVAHQRCLGASGSAGSELQDDGVVLGDRRPGQVGIGGEGEQVGEVVLDHDRRDPRIVALEAGEATAVGDQQGRAGGLEPVLDLAPGPPAVEADRHGAHGRTGPEGEDVLGAVGGEDRHPVAVSDPPVGEGCGHRGDLSLEAAEREDPSLTGVVEHRVLGVAVLGGPDQEVPQRPGPGGEHLHRLTEDLLGGELEIAAGAGECSGRLLVGQRGVAHSVAL